MATNILDFFTKAADNQFSRDFFMRIVDITSQGLSLYGEDELVYARTASLPGRDIENKTVNYSGQIFNINGRALYPGSDSYAIEFYSDQNMDLRRRLETMSRSTFNHDDGGDTTGQLCMPGAESSMTLQILKAPCGQGNAGGRGWVEAALIKLIGVNIRTIGAIEYQIADGTGEVQKIPTTWSYHWYEEF